MRKYIALICSIALILASCEQPMQTEFIGYTDLDYERLMVGEWEGYEGQNHISLIFENTNLVEKIVDNGSPNICNYSVSGNKLSLTIINSGASVGVYYFFFDDADTMYLRKTDAGSKTIMKRIH